MKWHEVAADGYHSASDDGKRWKRSEVCWEERGRWGGARSAGMICKLLGFKWVLQICKKHCINYYDKIASWESLLGYKFVQK